MNVMSLLWAGAGAGMLGMRIVVLPPALTPACPLEVEMARTPECPAPYPELLHVPPVWAFSASGSLYSSSLGCGNILRYRGRVNCSFGRCGMRCATRSPTILPGVPSAGSVS